MFTARGLGVALAALRVIGFGLTAAPGSAKAWWAGGWGWHGGVRPPIIHCE
jgi:hypothetical protein